MRSQNKMKRMAFQVHETRSVVLKKGIWSEEEDRKLISYINRFGIGNWSHIPSAAGLARTAKSCRFRWMNYLRPNIRHRNFTKEEVATIIEMQNTLGNQWATIAAVMPGRTDNDIKNFWNTHLKKRRSINPNVPRHDNSKEGASKCIRPHSGDYSTTSDGITATFDRKEVRIRDLERMSECNWVLFQEHRLDSWTTTDDMTGLGSPCSLVYDEFKDSYDFFQWWSQVSFCPTDDVLAEDFWINFWHHSPLSNSK